MITGKTISSLLPCLLLLLPLTAQAEPLTLPQLMATFTQVKARSADYVEQQNLSILEMPLESRGTLTFQAPDMLEKTVANGDVSYRVEGQQLRLEQNGEQHLIALDNYPALAAFVASFRATLAGDSETLQRYYHVTLHGTADNWRLSLEPKQSDMATIIRTITLHGSGNRIHLIETLEQSGDSSRMQLVERNEKQP